jgi:hypothetical protein
MNMYTGMGGKSCEQCQPCLAAYFCGQKILINLMLERF